MQIIPKQANKGEHIYRSIKDKINATAIKKFIDNRQGFVREYILGEPIERKDTAATIMGSMVHCLVLEKEKFDDKFVIATCNPPVGQMKELVDNLYARTVKCMNEDGEVTLQLSILLDQAIQDTKYSFDGTEKAFKGKDITKILNIFEGDAEMYYKELRSNYGKIVVTMYQIEKAELIVNEMKSNEWISEWINAVDNDDRHVYNEHMIEFEYKGLKMKALLDRFIVNHLQKTIVPVDIKSSWDPEGVEYTYLKNKWYVQVGVYHWALQQFKAENGLDDYIIEPLKFLICDTNGFSRSYYYQPLDVDVQMALVGFKIKTGKRYTGVITVVDEIAWAVETGIWNSTKEQYENQGYSQLGINYEK